MRGSWTFSWCWNQVGQWEGQCPLQIEGLCIIGNKRVGNEKQTSQWPSMILVSWDSHLVSSPLILYRTCLCGQQMKAEEMEYQLQSQGQIIRILDHHSWYQITYLSFSQLGHILGEVGSYIISNLMKRHSLWPTLPTILSADLEADLPALVRPAEIAPPADSLRMIFRETLSWTTQ